MSNENWTLILYDSEGGDYCRSYSEWHKCELYLHRDWTIYNYNPFNGDWNIYLSNEEFANHLSIKRENTMWSCNECCSTFSCEKYYPSPPETCEDCEDNE